MRDYSGNAYVECSECGHPIERHTRLGCDYRTEGCPCTTAWTVKEIQRVRMEDGLPGSFKSYDF